MSVSVSTHVTGAGRVVHNVKPEFYGSGYMVTHELTQGRCEYCLREASLPRRVVLNRVDTDTTVTLRIGSERSFGNRTRTFTLPTFTSKEKLSCY